jgi:hypothetical protein
VLPPQDQDHLARGASAGISWVLGRSATNIDKTS